MNESELKPGDLIFFINHYKPEKKAEYSHEYTDHVAMFAGFDVDQKTPLILHAISADKGHYSPMKQSGLCYSTLRPLADLFQKADPDDPEDCDQYYDVSYQVFRYKDPSIVARAREILAKQASFRLPYDEKRLKAKIDREKELEAEGFLEQGKNAYQTEGRYRALKYATRYPQPWTRTRRDGVGRGIICSMAMILAFQVAELLEIGAVKKLDELPKKSDDWISDKYAQIPENPNLSEAYLNYLRKIRPADGQDARVDSHLSYEFWKEDKAGPLDAYTHKTLAIDAKSTGTEGLHLYLQDNVHWEALGQLNVTERSFSPAQREEDKKRKHVSYTSCLTNLSEVVHRNPSLISPRLSDAPSPDSQGRRASVGESSKLFFKSIWLSAALTPEPDKEVAASASAASSSEGPSATMPR